MWSRTSLVVYVAEATTLIGPGEPAPLRGMISNMEHHGPSYLQWNIALYDDNVLWIVPGSHRQTNTDQVNHQLAEDSSVPLSVAAYR